MGGRDRSATSSVGQESVREEATRGSSGGDGSMAAEGQEPRTGHQLSQESRAGEQLSQESRAGQQLSHGN